MTRLAHITDLHLGWPSLPVVIEALVEAAHAVRPDAVVVTGDLVEWADRDGSWCEAKALLDRLPEPRVVVPGNHDLPLLNPIARAVRPYAAWRRHLGLPLEPPPLTIPGAVIVPLNTARRLAFDLGAVSRAQRDAVGHALAAAPPDALRVVALHHGLRHLDFSRFRNSVYGHREALRAFVGAGVDLALTGHNHFPHVERLEVAAEGGGRPGESGALTWAQAGTACSRRFRNPAYRRCSFHVIDADPGAPDFAIEAWSCGPDERAFRLERRLRAPRARP